jgi:hypothetical protein
MKSMGIKVLCDTAESNEFNVCDGEIGHEADFKVLRKSRKD